MFQPKRAGADRGPHSYEHLDMLMREMHDYPRVTEADMPALIGQYRRGRTRTVRSQAGTHIVLGHIRIAVRCALTYARFGMPVADLLNDAVFGLLDALDRYQPGRGAFSTIATYRVQHETQRAFQNGRHLVRLPIHLQTFHGVVLRTETRLRSSLGRDPLTTELLPVLRKRGGPWTRVSEKELVSKMDVVSRRVGFEDPVPGKRSSTARALTIGDTLATPHSSPAEETDLRHAYRFLDDILKAWAASKTRRDRQKAYVMRRRFGLDGKKPQDHEKISRRLRISRSLVRAIEQKAIAEILQRSAQNGFVDPDEMPDLAKYIRRLGTEAVL